MLVFSPFIPPQGHSWGWSPQGGLKTKKGKGRRERGCHTDMDLLKAGECQWRLFGRVSPYCSVTVAKKGPPLIRDQAYSFRFRNRRGKVWIIPRGLWFSFLFFFFNDTLENQVGRKLHQCKRSEHIPHQKTNTGNSALALDFLRWPPDPPGNPFQKVLQPHLYSQHP